MTPQTQQCLFASMSMDHDKGMDKKDKGDIKRSYRLKRVVIMDKG